MSRNQKTILALSLGLAVLSACIPVVFHRSAESSETAAYKLLTADAAAVDYFLKIDGIDGESDARDHKGEIDILSWSWGESQTATVGGGGGGAGKVNMQDFHFTMKVNKSSPSLMLATANGKHIKDATLVIRRKDKPQEYLKFKLTDILISSYQIGGSEGQLPTDQFSMNFGKIEMSYTTPDGEVITVGWDLKGNKET